MVSDFNVPVSLVELSLLINHRRGSSSKHCCVNNPPLSSILSVSQSSEGAGEQSSSPKRAKDTTQQLFWVQQQMRSGFAGWGGTCSSYPLHPIGPLVFIGTDTEQPFRRHQHRHKCTQTFTKYAPALSGKIGWSDLWSPTWRFMAYWKQRGQSTDRRECRVQWQERV